MVYRFIIKNYHIYFSTCLKHTLVYKQVDFSNNLTSKLLSRRKNHEFKKSGNA